MIHNKLDSRQSILITGATGGIGSKISEKLEKAGHKLSLIGQNHSSLGTLATKLQAEAIVMDMSDGKNAEQKIDKFLLPNPVFDWIIHCAGILETAQGLTEDFRKEMESVFAVNTLTPILLQHKLTATDAIQQGAIFISSTSSSGSGRAPIYAASKAALTTLGISYAWLWRDTEKRSIVIEPGPTNTPMREAFAGDAADKQNPAVIADVIQDILMKPNKYPNGTVCRIVEGSTHSYQALTKM